VIKLPKISSSQLIIMLVISRMFSMFTYKPTGYNISATAAAIAVAISVVINILIFTPTLMLLKKYEGRNVSDCAYLNFGSMGKIYSFLTLVICLFLSIECLTQFEIFMTSTIYMTASPVFFIIPMMLVVVYICRLGIESMARMANFVFGGLLFTVIAIAIAVAPEINTVWAESVSSKDVSGFFEFLAENVCNTTEIIPFMLLASNTKGNLKKGTVWFCVIIGVLFQLISFLSFTVLGNYRETVMFPFYTVAAMAESTLTERFNSAYTVLWVFMAAVKLCVYLLVAAKSLREFFLYKNDTVPLFISGSIVVFITLFTTQKITYVNAMYHFILSGIPIILLALVYPIAILIAQKSRERRRNK